MEAGPECSERSYQVRILATEERLGGWQLSGSKAVAVSRQCAVCGLTVCTACAVCEQPRMVGLGVFWVFGDG